MKRLDSLTEALLISLRSDECPTCGGLKKRMHTLCGICYRKLPRDMRENLYQLVGQGYEDACTDALHHLGCKCIRTRDDRDQDFVYFEVPKP